MFFSKTKLLKISGGLIVSALFFSLSVTNNFSWKNLKDHLVLKIAISQVEASGPSIMANDSCGFSTTKNATVNLNGNTSCSITGLTGFTGGDLNITGVNTIVTIKTGAKLVLDPGKWINLVPPKGQIRMETGGNINEGIVHGTLCILDTDDDGYADNGASFQLLPAIGSTKQACSVLGAHYREKSDAGLLSLTEYDCYSTDNTKHDCCTSGYKDYDKDGDGAGTSACYAPDAAYNIVANNYDCDDSNATIKNGWSSTSFCGTGTCGGSGTDSCTNGVRTNTCVTSSKLCCNAGVGTYKTAQTPISTCLKCNGTQADPVNQTSSEDLNNVCTTGGLGTGTSCRSANCSGTGDTCGALADATICNYGTFSAYSGVSGDCTLTSSRPIYKCSAGACSGTSSGTDFNTPQYIILGNVYNGSASVAATCALNKGYGAGMYCSGSAYGSTVQQSAYGCNGSGGSDTTTAKATCNQSTCSVRMENGISCTSGVCASTTNCSDTVDNDSDGLKDAADPQCGAGGCGQCTPSSTCCDSLGCYLSSSTLCLTDSWSGYTGANGACTMGRSQTYHNCNGTGTCSASVAGTNFETQYAPSEGKIVSANTWITATAGNNRGIVSPYSCASNTTINGSFVGCNTAGATGTVVQGTTATGTTCSGAENSMCIAGNSSCVNACISPYSPADNNGNGYTDGADAACGGCGVCTSGACCNVATGCYITLASNTTCSTCTPNTGASGACQITGTGYKCSGTSASCITTAPYATSCTGNASTVGNIWNGSSWVAASCSLYSSLGSPYSCSSNTVTNSAYGCNTSGGADLTTVKATCNSTTCSGGTPKCVSGACKQCTVAGDCPSDSYWCSGNQAYYRTNSCSSNSCSYVDSTRSYCDAASTKTCYSGSCVCQSGYYDNAGTCTICPAGSYCQYGSRNLCPNGTMTGSTGQTSCTSCAAGAYNIGTGNTSCIGCDPGYYCLGGGNHTACPAGTYQPLTGNVTSSSYCLTCPSETTSSSGASICYCAASSGKGYSWSNVNYKTTQRVNKSSGPGSCYADRNCDPVDNSLGWIINDGCTCPAGYGVTSDKVAPPTVDCYQCPAGEYSPGTTHLTARACDTCPGVSTSAAGAGTCYCPAGTINGYSYGNINLGSSTTGSKSPCHWSGQGNFTTTVTCSADGVVSNSGGSYGCNSGYQYTWGAWYLSTYGCTDVCVLSTCSAGSTNGYSVGALSHQQYSYPTRSISNGSCTGTIQCSDGSLNYQGESCGCNSGYTWNGSSCVGLTCGSGYYVSGGSCVACSGGTYKSGTNSATSCSTCPTGSYAPSGSSSCTSCSPGTYSTTSGSSSSICTSCPSGSYCTGGSSNSYCSAGSYSTGGASSCTTCSAGSYNSGSGASTCSPCPASYYCTGGSNLTSCGAGYTSPSSSTSSSACTQITCGPGQYLNGAACSTCSAGTYKSGTNSVTSCSTCSGGTYSSSGAGSCTSCSAGSYSSSGASSCTSCSAGTYSSTSGSSSSICSTCPANYYCTGGSNLTSCGAGYTSPSGSSSSGSCTAFTCGSGYYVSGGNSCVLCSNGYVKSGTNTATSCTYCSAGTYVIGTGGSSCTTCPTKYYCTGGSSLVSCGAGYSSSAGCSSSSCCYWVGT